MMSQLHFGMKGDQSKFDAKHTKYSGNTAHMNGGAIFVAQTDFTGLELEFYKNSAAFSGGAVYVKVCYIFLPQK